MGTSSSRPNCFDHLLLLVGYLLLDWASYIHPLPGLNIAPWGPASALGVFFLVRRGAAALPTLWLALFLADVWVRELPATLPATVVLSGALALGYWAIAESLRRWIGDSVFRDLPGLRDWALIVGLGALANRAVFVSLLMAFQLLPHGGWYEVLVHAWVGDGVGLVVMLPAFWLLLEPDGRAQLRGVLRPRPALLYMAAVPACLWFFLGIGVAHDFKYFAVLFLPLVVASAVQGLGGAMVCAAVLQLGIVSGLVWLDRPAVTVLEVQLLFGGGALCGFLVGVLIDERLRLRAELRQTLRLAAAGEMAGALAHELNQPITALSAYGAACEELLDRERGSPALKMVLRRMVGESTRAADVVCRLRDFFLTGATRLEVVAVGDIVVPVVDGFAGRAAAEGVRVDLDIGSGGFLLADRLQIAVVLRNLLANAFDAVALCGSGKACVAVTVERVGGAVLRITVEDSGPGLVSHMKESLFEAFRSSKSRGLGVGLAISRAIVEGHGGRLWADDGGRGVFRIELPLEETQCET